MPTERLRKILCSVTFFLTKPSAKNLAANFFFWTQNYVIGTLLSAVISLSQTALPFFLACLSTERDVRSNLQGACYLEERIFFLLTIPIFGEDVDTTAHNLPSPKQSMKRTGTPTRYVLLFQYTTLSWRRSVRFTTHIVQPLSTSSCGPCETLKELFGEKMTSPSRGIELYHFT